MTHDEAIKASMRETLAKAQNEGWRKVLAGEFDTAEMRAKYQRRLDEYLARKPLGVYADDVSDLVK